MLYCSLSINYFYFSIIVTTAITTPSLPSTQLLPLPAMKNLNMYSPEAVPVWARSSAIRVWVICVAGGVMFVGPAPLLARRHHPIARHHT